MSATPRVYQGVRVKTTVKELLQRHRAREANSKKVKTISQAYSDLQELYASTFPSRYVDPPPLNPPADVISCGAASFPLTGSACGVQTHEGNFSDVPQQFGDVMLPSNGYNIINNNNNNNNNSSYSAPPPPSLPLPWCHGLSSDVDYYGPGMAPCSSPESLCYPVDHNSYSPQDSFSSSSSSSCYDSPTRMEAGYHGLSSEHYPHQHCSLQDCYCLSHCWPGQQESFSAPEYAPYSSPTDYPYACSVEENYFKRDLQMSSEMCYNVL